MDYDFSSLLGQPTSPIIPALLPLAESIGATPAEVMAAFIVGFEVCLRVRARRARAVLGRRLACGERASAPWAPPWRARASLKVPREHIPDILGIAASLSGGVSANFGTMTKPLHSGTSRPQRHPGGDARPRRLHVECDSARKSGIRLFPRLRPRHQGIVRAVRGARPALRASSSAASSPSAIRAAASAIPRSTRRSNCASEIKVADVTAIKASITKYAAYAHRRRISDLDREREVQHAVCGGLHGALRARPCSRPSRRRRSTTRR